MIEYRAVLLTNRKLERPIQSISLSLTAIKDWIEKTVAKYPNDKVILYKTEETEVAIFSEPSQGIKL